MNKNSTITINLPTSSASPRLITTKNSTIPNGNNTQRLIISSSSSPPLSASKPKKKNRHRAKPPTLSAIVSSAAVLLIWALVFVGWLWRQYKKRVRAKRRAARGLPPKVKKPKKPLPTFILPPDPAVITGQREPGERAIPHKHGHGSSADKNSMNAIELNERNRTVTEAQIHDEMIARQVFAKHSPLDPPKPEKRGHARGRFISTWFVLTNYLVGLSAASTS